MERLLANRFLIGFLAIVAFIAMPSCKAKNRDADIQTAFNSKVQSDPNFAGVSATVVDGTVTLTGNCADETCRANAEKSVKEIDGVKKVVNNIQVAKVEIQDDAPLRSSAEQVASKYDGVQACFLKLFFHPKQPLLLCIVAFSCSCFLHKLVDR